MKKIIYILLILMVSFSIFSQEIVKEDLINELEFWSSLEFEYSNNTLYIYDFYSEDYNDISRELFSTLNAVIYYLQDINIDLKYLELNINYEWRNNLTKKEYKLEVDPEWLISYILIKDRREQQDIFNRELLPIYNTLINDFKTYQYDKVEQAIQDSQFNKPQESLR